MHRASQCIDLFDCDDTDGELVQYFAVIEYRRYIYVAVGFPGAAVVAGACSANCILLLVCLEAVLLDFAAVVVVAERWPSYFGRF